MRYFAGFVIEGEAAQWHNALVQEIATRFNLPDLSQRIPPHITLYFTPELKDPTALKTYLREWASHQGPLTFHMKGFGTFAHKSVFASVEADGATGESVAEARHTLRTLEPDSVPHNYFPWQPHASLARNLDPEKFEQIWHYLSTQPPYAFPLTFDKLTLLRLEGGHYVVDEEFPFQNNARINVCFSELFAIPSGRLGS
jgi:2'-5' RNA ligase